MVHKTCNVCKEEFPATTDYFYESKNGKFGLYARCKECVLKAQKKYVRNNPEKRKETTKKYNEANKEKVKKIHNDYWSLNKERFSQWRKTRRLEHYEEFLVREKEYRENRRDQINEIKRKYRISDKAKQVRRRYFQTPKGKELILVNRQKRMALKKSLPINFDMKTWEETLLYFNNQCAYCGKETDLEQEHFIPLTKNGEYTRNNIIPACKSCNCSKKDRDFFKWYPRYKYYSKRREQKILKYLNYKDDTQQLALL